MPSQLINTTGEILDSITLYILLIQGMHLYDVLIETNGQRKWHFFDVTSYVIDVKHLCTQFTSGASDVQRNVENAADAVRNVYVRHT